MVQRTDKVTHILQDVKTNQKHPSPVHVNSQYLQVDHRDILFSRVEDLGFLPTEPETDSPEVTDSQTIPIIDAQQDTSLESPNPITTNDENQVPTVYTTF